MNTPSNLMNPNFIDVEPGHVFAITYPRIQLANESPFLLGGGGLIRDGENHMRCYRSTGKEEQHGILFCNCGYVAKTGMTQKAPPEHESVAVIEMYGQTVIDDDYNSIRSEKARLRAIVLRDGEELLRAQEHLLETPLRNLAQKHKAAKSAILDYSFIAAVLLMLCATLIMLGTWATTSIVSVGCYTAAAYIGFSSVRLIIKSLMSASTARATRPGGAAYVEKANSVEEAKAMAAEIVFGSAGWKNYTQNARKMIEEQYPGVEIYPDLKSLLMAYQGKITLHGSVIQKYARDGWPKS